MLKLTSLPSGSVVKIAPDGAFASVVVAAISMLAAATHTMMPAFVLLMRTSHQSRARRTNASARSSLASRCQNAGGGRVVDRLRIAHFRVCLGCTRKRDALESADIQQLSGAEDRGL